MTFVQRQPGRDHRSDTVSSHRQNDISQIPRKRPVPHSEKTPCKNQKTVADPPSLHSPGPSHILEALFQAEENDTRINPIDLTMSSSDSDRESSYEPQAHDYWVHTPASSQATDTSPPPPASISSPAKKQPSEADSSPRNPRRAPSVKASPKPSWSLFREESPADGLPERIFLPMQLRADPGRVKAETEIVELAKLAESDTIDLDEAEEFQQEANKDVAETEEHDEEPHMTANDEAKKDSATSSKVSTLVLPQDGREPLPRANTTKNTALSARALPPFVVVEGHMRVSIMQHQKDGRPAVPWGVQYYLASLASFGYLELNELNIAAGINALRATTNEQAIRALFGRDKQRILWQSSQPETPVMARSATDREIQVCAELDRETEMLAESSLNGILGPPGEEMRSFGGRVLFEGRIFGHKVDSPPKKGNERKHRTFSIRLLPPKLGGSCRFSRRFGSVSILRLKMDAAMAKDARRFAKWPKTREIQQEIAEFFGRTVQIMGRRYRPFMCKDETIFYLWVGSPPNNPDQPPFDCIWDFVDHHAPFADNARSPLGKFIQRLQLGLSTSVPASQVKTVRYVNDVRGDPHPETGERVVMTDGAGAVSLAVMQDIAQQLGYASIPSAVQVRFAGAKGVWYIDPSARHWLPGEEPTRSIEIRRSQNKIEYPKGETRDLSQKVIDLLGPSRLFSPSTLSKQIILVLHSNGVPMETFVTRLQDELREIANSISDWDGPDASVCLRLATVVERYCNVEATRAKRSTEAAEHRAQGMESARRGHATDSDDTLGGDDRDVFFGQDGRHTWNGKPISKHEGAYEMLQVGFHPRTCPHLADLLVEIAEMRMKRNISSFAIPIARSAEAMVIPDPTGTLEADEIQFRFSGDAVLDPESRLRLKHVPEGEVLVTRHPCLLPTDIRKVKAVVKPELSMYEDVVVFSTKGHTPLASLLSGGDYDGDLIRVFWEPALVVPFINADVKYATCPFEISEVFHRSEETVADFVAEHGHKDKEARDRALIPHLVAGAFDPSVRGLYGVMHLYAAWQFGVDSTQAVDLAHKFCQCMDAPKTGLSIKSEVRIADSKKYMADLPEWAYDEHDDGDPHDWFALDEYNTRSTAVTNASKRESVLCELWNEGKKELGRLKQKLAGMTEKLRGTEDIAISGLWKEAKELGTITPEEEEAIRGHVEVMLQTYQRTNMRTRKEIDDRRKAPDASARSAKERKRETKATPLRRVRSEATPAMLGGTTQGDQKDEDGTTVDDSIDNSEMLDRLNESIEVPATLGSASEVAARFCQWPKAFAKSHVEKLDSAAVARLALLRASFCYLHTYRLRPRFAFDMAWRWILDLKADSEGDQVNGGLARTKPTRSQAHGSGSIRLPSSTLNVLRLSKGVIARNIESSRGRGFEI